MKEFKNQIPTEEEFETYKQIASAILTSFADKKLKPTEAIHALEIVSAYTLSLIGKICNENPMPYVDPFATNIRAFIPHLQDRMSDLSPNCN